MRELEVVITKAEACVAQCQQLNDSVLNQLSLYQAENSDQSLRVIKELLAFHGELSDLAV